jgi:transposase InsO family protein
MEDFIDLLSKATIKKDDEDNYKTLKIPQFSDGTEWEAVVFELEINLDKVWKHKDEMDIVDYLSGIRQTCAKEFIEKADKLIYNVIVNASKRDSFARKQIMASRHPDAIPQVERNEGLKLFSLFQSIFLNKSRDQANLPKALTNFHTMKMEKNELAKDYIARVDLAVSDLALLGEKVSLNSWLFTLANGLRNEYKNCKNGVLFNEQEYRTILEVKSKILKEETINGIGKVEKDPTQKETEIAHAVFDGNCNYCYKKGHKKSECRKLKKDQENGSNKPSNKYWCDLCQKAGHSTDYCSWNPNPTPAKGKGGKGKKGKGKPNGKGYGRGQGKGTKGKQSKGGRGQSNYPASYTPETVHYATENWATTQEPWDLQEEESSSADNYDYSLSVIETDKSEHLSVIMENENNPNWSENNYWTQSDFNLCTWEDQPACNANTVGPECDFAFMTFSLKQNEQAIKEQFQMKLKDLNDSKAKGQHGLWMYLDSGASRSVIHEQSPIRPHLRNISPEYGSCNVGNGANLQYLEKGSITENNTVTVVKDLKYDLYAAVAAAKRGVSCVLDYTAEGENHSYLFCKKTRTITPLIERKQGILEVPVHLYINKADKGLMVAEKQTPALNLTEKTEKTTNKFVLPTNQKLSMASISKFWHGMDASQFDPHVRNNNSDEISLFTFDIINSLGQRQKDFLIHARMAHLPRKAILQMIKNGAKGLPYQGKFKELCRPCIESKHRAENHGKQLIRHPNGKIGEHLHSDLAVVNLNDTNGYKYVLTVVDEISDEVIVALLKNKTAQNVLIACKKILSVISARNKSQLKSWQFDRGSEFMNKQFEKWIVEELGAKQMFSNIEHPWENGRAERSFATMFQKARAMIKHADLPIKTWGKAIQHAVYLKNRSPSTRLDLLSPLQFRTGEPQDFTNLRVFGCPAQIFVRPSERGNNKLSDRSEKGTFLGMSKHGNGYIFRIQRINKVVEIDSKDVKFNETFSDCMDRKGKLIKGGRVLDPDLLEIELAPRKENNSSKINNDHEQDEADNEQNERSSSNDHGEIDSNKGDNSSNSSTDIDEESNNEGDLPPKVNFTFKKPFEEKTKEKLKVGPIKSSEKISRSLKSIQASTGFQEASQNTSPQQNKDQSESIGKRTRKTRALYEPTFDSTYKRKEAALFTEQEHDDSSTTTSKPADHHRDEISRFSHKNYYVNIEPEDNSSDDDDDLILMMQDYNQRDLDDNTIHEIEEEKSSSNDESQLDQEGERNLDYEKHQMQADISHMINSSTDRIIESFENIAIDDSDNDNRSYGTPDESMYTEYFKQSIDHFYHGGNESEESDIYENTDTDDGANDEIDLEHANPDIIALIQRQKETIIRLRIRIERLNEAMDEIITGGADPRDKFN